MASTTLRVYETSTLLARQSFTGNAEQDLQIVSGSRMLITLLVTACDVGASVDLFIDNSFTGDNFDTIENFGVTGAAGRVKRIISDYHNNFKFRVQVTGGNADFAVGITAFDNAGTTRIDNAQLSVSLDHTTDSLGHFDSIRIGNGTNLMGVNSDGSLNVKITASVLPAGAATEAKQDVGNALLTQIRDNADGVEGLVAAGNGSLASIDTKVSTAANQAATNVLLTAGNGSLTSVDSKLGTLGQKAMAGSAPVVLASDQSPVNVHSTTPIATTVKQGAITVGLTAVRLTTDGNAPSATRVALAATPDPNSVANFYIGSSSVTTTGATRGIPLVVGEKFTANLDAGDYYIISDTAGQTVFVMEQE